MKTTTRIMRFALPLILVNCLAAVAPAQAPVRILPLGDSITRGFVPGDPTAGGGYRNLLYSELTTAGFNVDFIGNFTDVSNPGLPDTNHEGTDGIQIEALRATLPFGLKVLQDPDVILLHIGTNDFSVDPTPSVSQVQDRTRSLLADLAQLRPHARILISNLIPRTDDPNKEAAQLQFSNSLQGIVDEQTALGRKVTLANLRPLLAGGDLIDGVHPNATGYNNMAMGWKAAIQAATTPLGDSDVPRIAGVDARADLTHVTIKFSKPVEDAAAVTSNFGISGGVTVLSAELDAPTKRLITLTTTAQTAGRVYALTVNGVRDRTPELNTIPAQTKVNFTAKAVEDGSFEAGGTSWVKSNNYEVLGAPRPATDGGMVLVFNGANATPNGIVSQAMSTIPGVTYRLSFDMGVNGLAQLQSLALSIVGSSPLVTTTESLMGPGSGVKWAAKSYQFVANSTTTTVTITDTSAVTTSVDLLIDDVRLEGEFLPLLSVDSSPANGVSVDVSPLDNGGNGNGTTQFTRTYDQDDVVNLTTPASFGGRSFHKWLKDGVSHSYSTATSVTMDLDHSMTAAYSILGNGSFELGAPVSFGFVLDGWTVTGATAGSIAGNPVFGFPSQPGYVATDGGRVAVFNGGANNFDGAISRSFTTSIGQSYTVAYDLGITGTSGIAQQLLVTAQGNAQLLSRLEPITTTGTPTLWASKIHTFVADSTSTTITFADATTPGNGIGADMMIDNVRIEEFSGNVAPVAVADTYAATTNTPLTIAEPGVLDNDTDSNLNDLTAIKVSDPAHGTVTLNSDGSFTYNPATDYSGTDSFTYKANDGFDDSNTVTVTLNVTAPSGGALANGSFEVGAIVSGSVTAIAPWSVSGRAFGYLADASYTATNGTRLAVLNGGNDEFDGVVSQTFDTVTGATYELRFDVGIYGGSGQKQRLSVEIPGASPAFLAEENLTSSGAAEAQWNARTYTFVAGGSSTTLTFSDSSEFLNSGEAAGCDLLIDHVRVILDGSGNNPPDATNDSYQTTTNTILTVDAPGVLVNDTDLDGNPLSAAKVSNPSNGTVTVNSNGSFTYTPSNGFTGTDSFTYKASDTLDDSNVATVSIEVNAPPPSAFANGSFELGAPANFGPLTNWSVTGSPFGYLADAAYSATNGIRIAVFNGNGTPFDGIVSQTFATVPGETYELQYDVGIYGDSGSKQRLTVAVPGANPPFTTEENLTSTGAATAQWTARSFTFVASSTSTTLSFTDDSENLAPGEPLGSDLLLDDVRVFLLGTGNNPPVATNDAYQASTNTPLVVLAAEGLLDNDTDVDSDPLMALKVSNPANGTVTVNTDGGFTYTPTNGYSGTDSFTYKANDGLDDSSVATVTIEVTVPSVNVLTNGSFEAGTPANFGTMPPWVVTGSPFGYTTGGGYNASEGTRFAVFNGNTTAFGGVVSQTFGTVIGETYELKFDVGINGSAGNKQRLIAAVPGANPPLSESIQLTAVEGPTQWSAQTFTFVASASTTTLTFSDDSGSLVPGEADASDLLLDNVRVLGAPSGNVAPVANNDFRAAVVDTELTVAAPGVLGNDTDTDTLTAVKVSDPQHGAVTLNTDGSFSYTPSAGYIGPDSFTYKAFDGLFDSNVATVFITVTGAVVDVLANGGFELPSVSFGPLENWILTGTPFGYLADAGYTATEGIRLAIFNGGDDVHGEAVTQTFATVPGGIYELRLDAGILGGMGKKQRLTVSVPGANPPLTGQVNLTNVSGGSAAEWSVDQSFTFVAGSGRTTLIITDTSNTLAPGEAIGSDLLLDNVRVLGADPENVLPFANNDSFTAAENFPLTLAAPGVLANDTDGDGDTLTAIKVTDPANGTVTVNANGGFVYTPATDFVGTDSFTYKVNDGKADSDAATVTIEVEVVPPGFVGNGSFEIGAATGFENRTFLDFWTVTGNPFGVIENPSYTATEGDRLAVFNGGSDVFFGSISQTVTTVPGTAYRLNLDLGILGLVGQKQRLEVKVLGASPTALVQQTEQLTSTDSLAPAQWNAKSYPFIADGTSITLAFTDMSDTLGGQAVASDLLLDNIRIVPMDVRTLSVSSAAVSGLNVQVTPADLYGFSNSVTPFSRGYEVGSEVTLTATFASGPNVFEKWQKNGVDYSTQLTTSVTMDDDHAMTAIYVIDNNPRAVADSFTVDEDEELVVAAPGILANDFEPNLLPLTAELIDGPADGTLDFNTDGGFSYTPDLDFNGTDSFTYRVTNGTDISAAGTVTINISPVNDLPVAANLLAETDEDVAAALDLIVTDADTADTLSLIVVDPPLSGTLSGSFPNMIYTPAADFNGTDVFTYQVSDGTGLSNLATVTITVVPVVDEFPIADSQSLTMTAGTSIPVVLTGRHPDGQPVTFELVTSPTNGALIGTPPNLTYWPTPTFVGSDTFTFITTDGTADSLPATVSISVGEVLRNGSFEQATGIHPNRTPDFWNHSGNFEIANESLPGRTATDGALLVMFNHGTNTPNAVLSQSFATTPGRPYVLRFDMGLLSYTSANQRIRVALSNTSLSPVEITRTGFNGGNAAWLPYEYAFTANSTVATLSFTDISPAWIGADMLLDKVRVVPGLVRGLAVASTPNSGVPVTVSPAGTSGAGSGSTPISRLYNNGVVVSLSVPPTNGLLNFQKWLRNGVEYSTNPSTTVTMNAEYQMTAVYVDNEPPLTDADTYSTDEDTELVVSAPGVLTNDADPETLPITAAVVAAPANGDLVLNTDGGFTYMPDEDFAGTDTFTYRASDGAVQSEVTTVTITVNPINDAPVAVVQSVDVVEDTATPIMLVAADAEGDDLTYTVGTAEHGSISGTAPNLTYTPAENYSGPDSFSFTVNDGVLDSLPAVVTINVTPVNDAPVASAQSLDVVEDTPTAIALVTTEVDGDTLTYTVVNPTNGTLSGTAPNLTYTPNLNYTGPDSFSFTVNDGTVDSNSATVTINVTPVNDAPVAVAQSVNVVEDTATAIVLTATDAEGESLTYSVGTPAHGSITGTAPNLTYTPAGDYTGPDSFSFTVSDGSQDSAPGVVTINVTPVNDAPVASSQSLDVVEDTPTAITLVVADVDLDSLDYTIVPPSNGTLSGTAPNLTYTPAENYTGSDSFSFTANDGTVDSNSATVTINVTSVNDVPVASVQNLDVVEDTPTAVVLSATDAEGTTLAYTVGNPSHGVLTGTAPNLTYTPAENYTGPDSFSFTVNDGAQDSVPAVVTLNVTPVNDAPVATVQSVDVVEDTPTAISLVASDVDGDSLSYTVGMPAHGSLSGTAPNLTYTPADNYTGPDSFSFTVNDGTVESNSAAVTINVTLVNDMPVASSQSLNVVEDTATSIALVANDIDGDSLTYILGNPAHGTLSGTAPNLTYTPNGNYTGPDSFSFSVNDGTQSSVDATVTINVTPVNDAPVASAQSVNVEEDAPTPITLVASDVDGNNLTYLVGTPQHGTLSGTAPNLTYTPNLDYSGPDSFNFLVSDGTLSSNTATISINVIYGNDIPEANAQLVNTQEDVPASIVLTGSDVENSPLIYEVVVAPSHGTLSGTGANLTYTPAADYHGNDSFTFRVNDGLDNSDPATVSIVVTPINDAPVASAQLVNVTEDLAKSFALVATDVDGDSLTYSLGVPAHGTLSGTAPNLSYTPVANYHGPDSFSYTVNDGLLNSAQAVVTINIMPVSDAPVASSQSVTVTEDSAQSITLVGSDADEDMVIYAVAAPSHGTLSGIAPNLTYTPSLNYTGPDQFSFVAIAGMMVSNLATVTINVTPVNDAPVASAQSLNAAEETATPITLTGSDVDGDSLTYTVVMPAHGSLSGVAPNLIYTSATNYNGPVSFSFTVNDGILESAPAVVSINVTPVNDAPVAISQSLNVVEDMPTGIALGSSDIDGDTLSYTVGPLAHGTLTGTAPNLTYTPSQDYYGPDSFSFTVSDGQSVSAPATVTVNVTPANDAPVASAQSKDVVEDTTTAITLVATDIDGDSFTYSVGTPTHGALSGFAPNLSYTPADDYTGPDSFSFTVNDGEEDSEAVTISITVTPVNDAPVASAQSVNVVEDTPTPITLAGSDIDGDSLTYTLGTPSNGTLTGTAPNLTFTPAVNYTGPASFTFTVSDGTLSSAPATVSITVTPVNDAPAASAQSVNVVEDTPTPITLVASDIDGDSLTYSVGTPSNGTLTGTAPNLTFTPAANYTGPASFTFTVSDGTLTSAPATVSITVTPVNDTPVANAQSVNVVEDTPTPITLTGSDIDGDSLTYNVGTPSNGTLTGTAPNLTFTPAANYTGPASFTFTVSDGTLTSAPATVSITVTPANDTPVASAQSVTLVEDTPTAIMLVASDIDGDSLTYTLGTSAHGTLSGTGPNVTYTPDEDYTGPDAFTFTVNDGLSDSVEAIVTINVTPVNDAPDATAQSVVLDQNTSLGIVLAGTDAEGDTLGFNVTVQPSHGALSGTAANVTYTPEPNYSGPDSFSFTVTDGPEVSAPAVVSIMVNDVPGAGFTEWLAGFGLVADPKMDSDNFGANNGLEYVVGGNPANENNSNIMPTTTFVSADPDGNMENSNYVLYTYRRTDRAKNDPLTTIKVEWNDDFSGPWTNAVGSPGAVVLEENDFYGPGVDRVRVYLPRTLTPNGSLFVRLNIAINVPPVNQAPIANGRSVTVNEDGSIGIVLAATDANGDALIYSLVDNPTHGTLAGTIPNLTYTPAANYAGPDSFSFKASDGLLDSIPATVSIVVTPVNDVPSASSQSVIVVEDTPTPITLAASDIEGNSLTYAVGTPTQGTLSGTAPNLTYTPPSNYHGPASFTFTVNDGTVSSAPATVSITVTPVNDTPLAFGQTLNVVEDSPTPITLVTSDADGDTLTYTVGTPTSGTLSGTAPNLTYTPAANYNGPASFSFTVSDGTVSSDSATVSITVTPVNDVPLASGQTLSVVEDTATPITLVTSDADGDTLTYSLGTPTSGTLSGTAPNLIYTPASNFTGPASFSFTVSDGNAVSAPATVNITVTPVPDAPVAFSQNVVTLEDTAKAVSLLATDADGDPVTYVVGDPSNGMVTGTGANRLYTPDPNFFGTDSFTFLAIAGGMPSNIATVTITVTAVNDAPLGIAQSVAVVEDTPKSIVLSATDIDGGSLTYTAGSPAHGVLSGVAPNLTYTPAQDYVGPDSFTFTANDGTVNSAPVTVTIMVSPSGEFGQWLAGFGVNAGPNVDSDHDSLSNAVEYVVGGNPASQNNSNLLPTVEMVVNPVTVRVTPPGEYLLFTYRLTDVANADPSATIKVEWNTGLSGVWTNADGTHGEVTVVEDVPGEVYSLVKVYIPRPPAGGIFARLGVVISQP